MSPALPRNTGVQGFQIDAGFSESISDEDKAQFYRAFDLTPDVDWLSLTKPMIYLKGEVQANVGLMADLTGKEPGLYTGKVRATRKSKDQVVGAPVHEFDLVYSALIPHRVTPENRGHIQTAGKVEPGCVDRIFVEVPPGIKAVDLTLRLLEGGRASWVSASLFDPEGVHRGGAGPVSEQGSTESSRILANQHVVPGTWEIVVNSSIRSRVLASYDLSVTLSGVGFGEPVAFTSSVGNTTRQRLLVPLQSNQPTTFTGTVSGALQGFVKSEVVEVNDEEKFTRSIWLDNTTATATWNLDFDRETYALFTDCVLRLEDAETDKVIRNSALSQRHGTVTLSVPKNQKEPKEYRLVLLPAFTLKADSQQWHFVLTEKLKWSSGPLKFEMVDPKSGRLTLNPWDWINCEFRLPPQVPAVPEGYRLDAVLEATSTREGRLRFEKQLQM
jgi:hypothetical protein